MSVSNPSVVYTVDELFLADCTPSNFDLEDSDSMYSASFMDRSRKNNPNCGILAFYMLKFLVGRLLYNKIRYLKNLKFRALVKWKYWVPHESELEISELIIQKAFKVALRYFKSVLKNRWMKWVKFTRLAAVFAKFRRRKCRRDEIHNGQVKQVKRVIAQITLKKSETERDLESSVVNERKLKEIFEKNGKGVKSLNEVKKNKMALKKVMQENEDLKDTLEAINLNVGNLLKDMGGVMGYEDNHADQESGLEESQLRTSRRKKLSGLRY
jgi:hypothetical protein